MPLAAAAIFAAGLLAYGTSLGGPFVWDDPPSIVDNPTIRHLWPIWGAGPGAAAAGRRCITVEEPSRC